MTFTRLVLQSAGLMLEWLLVLLGVLTVAAGVFAAGAMFQMVAGR